jgi:hypothetical protein
MFFWFITLSIGGVAAVFRDPRLDHRLVAVGALLPLLLDGVVSAVRGPFGRTWLAHSLSVHVALLALAMGVSIGRKPLRKKLLAISIGGFAHLVLDGSWVDTAAFGWPISWPLGRAVTEQMQVLQRGVIVNMLLEAIGLGIGVLLYQRCRLHVKSRQADFRKAGRLELLPLQRRR